MTADVFFVANVVFAAICALLLWRARRLRTMVVFHVGALAVAIGLYVAMAVASEIPENRIPMKYIVQMIFGAAVYAPLVVYLVITYVGAFLSTSGGSLPPIPLMLKEACDNIDLGRLNEAAQTLRMVLNREPENPGAHRLMGDLQLARGQYQLAIGSYRLAMLKPEDDKTFAKLAFAVAEIFAENLGDYTSAAKELDLVRKHLPDTPEAAKAQKLIAEFMSR